MIKYPVEGGEKLINGLIDNSKTFYPITKRGFWHNGVHFTSDSAAVCNIHTGRVVAMRFTEVYECNEFIKMPKKVIDILTDYANEYFDLKDNFYTIKTDLSEKEHENAMIIVGATFSNNFVLVKHTVNNLYGKAIDFYSLAMHLRPLNRLSFAEKLATCWYEAKITTTPDPQYHYVTVSNVNEEEGANGEIPCETVINVLEEITKIEWTLNGVTETNFIEKSKYRKFSDGHYKIKRPLREGESNDTKDYLEQDEYGKESGLLIYEKGDEKKNDRVIKWFLRPALSLSGNAAMDVEFTYMSYDTDEISIDRIFYIEYIKHIGIPVSFTVDGNAKWGYIYPEFRHRDGKFFTDDEISVAITDFNRDQKKTEGDVIFLGNIGFTLVQKSKTISNSSERTFRKRVHGGCYHISVYPLDPTYNYVKSYDDIIKIPCEMVVTELLSKAKIQWNLNGSSKTGIIETSKYREVRDDHYEIRRVVRGAEGNDKGYYFDEEDKNNEKYSTGIGLIVYSTKDILTRTVMHLLPLDDDITFIDKTLVNDEYDVAGKTGIFVSFNDTQTGYIYPKFTGTANSIATFNTTIKTTVEKQVFLGNLTFDIKFKSGIEASDTPDKIITPDVPTAATPENTENFNVKTGDIIGYCGYGICTENENSGDVVGIPHHLKLPLHYEIFCPDVAFMKPNDKEDFPYHYKITGSFICYEGEPKTQQVLPTSWPHINQTDKYLKIEEEEKCIEGNIFYKVYIKAVRQESDYYIELEEELIEMVDRPGSYMYCANANNDEVLFSLEDEATIGEDRGLSYHKIAIGAKELLQDFYYVLTKNANLVVNDKDIPAGKAESLKPTTPSSNETVYKIAHLYDSKEICESMSPFWIKAEDLTGSTIKLSDSDYLLTSPLELSKILDSFGIAEYETSNIKTLENGILKEIDSSAGWHGTAMETGEVKYWKKIRHSYDKGTIGEYWIDSESWNTSLDNKSITKVSYHEWHEFFHEVVGHAPTDSNLADADLLKLFSEDDEAVGETFIDAMKLYDETDKTGVSDPIKSCAALKKVVYEHSTEWTKNEDYVTTFTKGYSTRNKERVKAQQKALIFDALEIADGKTNWYFHPISFIDHLNKVVAYDPYEGKVLNVRLSKKPDIKQIEVKSCFGFAPLHYFDTKPEPNSTSGIRFPIQHIAKPNYYWAGLNSVFGYSWGYNNYNTAKPPHGGIDLAGDEGDPIVSMIRGKVWAATWTGESNLSSSFGRLMIIKDMDKPRLYLLAHLSAYGKEPSEYLTGEHYVYPGDTVAYVGNTGNSDAAHLHLEVFECDADTEIGRGSVLDPNIYKNKPHGFVAKKSDDTDDEVNQLQCTGLTWFGKFNHTTKRINPLDHSEK